MLSITRAPYQEAVLEVVDMKAGVQLEVFMVWSWMLPPEISSITDTVDASTLEERMDILSVWFVGGKVW